MTTVLTEIRFRLCLFKFPYNNYHVATMDGIFCCSAVCSSIVFPTYIFCKDIEVYWGCSRVQECILSVSRGRNLSPLSIDRFCPEKPEMPTRIYFGMSPRPARINLISSLGGPCEDTVHCTLEKQKNLDLGFELRRAVEGKFFCSPDHTETLEYNNVQIYPFKPKNYWIFLHLLVC